MTLAHAQKYLGTMVVLTLDCSRDSSTKEVSAISVLGDSDQMSVQSITIQNNIRLPGCQAFSTPTHSPRAVRLRIWLIRAFLA